MKRIEVTAPQDDHAAVRILAEALRAGGPAAERARRMMAILDQEELPRIPGRGRPAIATTGAAGIAEVYAHVASGKEGRMPGTKKAPGRSRGQSGRKR